jgi:hypothetical protein
VPLLGRPHEKQDTRSSRGHRHTALRGQGDRVERTCGDARGIAPNGGLNNPGELLVFRYSRDRDTLKAVNG